jgi:hypothetical protein
MIPGIVELGMIYDRAYIESPRKSRAHHTGLAAVRDAVLEGVAQDSERVVLPDGGCWTSCGENEFNSIAEYIHSLREAK